MAQNKNQLTSALWYKDSDMETMTNLGLVGQKRHTDRSKVVYMCGKLHDDITNQDHYLPNGVDVHMRFVRSRDTFSLMAEALGDFKVKIDDSSLFVRRTKLNPEVQLAHIKAFTRSNVSMSKDKHSPQGLDHSHRKICSSGKCHADLFCQWCITLHIMEK